MQMRLMLLFLTVLSAVCAEVKFDEPTVAERPVDGEEAVAPLAAASPEEEDEDPAQVLEELEHQIFDTVGRLEGGELLPPDSEQQQQQQQQQQDRRQPKSPKKCCKLGRQVAENGLFCHVDLMQVQKRPNVVHRRKMKFHGPEVHGQTVYKDLMRHVEKCALSKASRSMFGKCCEWQEFIQHELVRCKTLPTLTERRQCRQRVQSRE